MKRVVLLKLSGEALSKVNGIGIDMEKVKTVAKEVKDLKDTGVSVGIVVGAGNIWRGRDASDVVVERVFADDMGMIGTILNALALKTALLSLNVKAYVASAIAVDKIVEPYNQEKVMNALANDEIVIFSGGTGNPYFSTDTTAALRACQIKADLILMAKNGTDGVYDDDPRKNANAKKYQTITYDEILAKHLQVMDLTAATLCYDNNLKIVVFDMGISGNIKKVINHPEIGTIITK